ncbi:hypothetical protein [Moorena sp. SIOASIH]|uniref:hypothetical protein n=1 Tax=Moorena sp. SIOASIH TaxID=2607817 RepID=UPI0025F9EAD0|nr:hypothetical protein [Moorena sp. SIOASIH]
MLAWSRHCVDDSRFHSGNVFYRLWETPRIQRECDLVFSDINDAKVIVFQGFVRVAWP